jgi:4'-phosphopantetheinyl transferase
MRHSVAFPGGSLCQVHCLHVPSELQGFEPSSDELARYLSADELTRYRRYRVQTKKAELYLARKFIKGLVAGIVNVAATSIELRPDASGKPFLFAEGREIPLHCNLSHTRGLIACVFCYAGNTGIDVEFHEGPHDDLVQRFFHPREVKDYMLLEGAEVRLRRFYDLWTLKESYVKAMGQGLYMALDSFWFSLPDGLETEATEIYVQQPRGQAKEPYGFFLSQPTPRHTLAVAIQTAQTTKEARPREFHYSLSADTTVVPMSTATS